MKTRDVRLVLVVGARPNLVKIAPIMAAIDRWNEAHLDAGTVRFVQTLVHTGQHYDDSLSAVFFRDLGIPEPDHHLKVGSGSHAQQTAAVLLRLEPVLLDEQPDLVVVVGDVNSTLAAALTAAKLNIPLAHVEAGLRSHDREMPEELNRLLTDQLASLLFTTEREARENLVREGIPTERIRFVGNTMIDALERVRPHIHTDFPMRALGLERQEYVLITLHRPSNVDEAAQLSRLMRRLVELGGRMPVVFPTHARTRKRLQALPDWPELQSAGTVHLVTPLSYLDFLGLQSGARMILTDSGGVQEESTILGVPCLTLRTSTERPITLTQGTNRLVNPTDDAAIDEAIADVFAHQPPDTPVRPELWDGHASDRIVSELAVWAEDPDHHAKKGTGRRPR